MEKKEIIERMGDLHKKVSSKGRPYTAVQREGMRKEISVLKTELEKYKLEEDICYINEFVQKHPLFFMPERAALQNIVDKIVNSITDPGEIFVLKDKFESFYLDLKILEGNTKTISDYFDKLGKLAKNEDIPSSNEHSFNVKRRIQKSLALNCKSIIKRIDKLNNSLTEIQNIISFFHNDNKLAGFVYLSDPIFSDASSFENGYSIVTQDSIRMYFAVNTKTYKIDVDPNDLPKIELQRTNPDLIPFETGEGFFNSLMGYKNSNGVIVIPAKFNRAYPFVNGFAKVGKKVNLLNGDSAILYGLIDQTGQQVLPFDFFEIGDVYNDVVLYKKHMYKKGYVAANFFNYDVIYETKHLGLFSGYLIYGELKPAIFIEIEKINEIKNNFNDLKTNLEVDKARDTINEHKDKIKLYLKTVIENQNNNDFL